MSAATNRRVAAIALVVTLFTGGCGSGEQPPSAAEQVPQLSVVLERVDDALEAHRFQAARQQLRALKARVIDAREAGELDDADAARVLEAIARLLALLPDPEPTPSKTPEAETPLAEPEPPTASHRPERRKSTEPAPTRTPTPSVSPKTIPTPTRTPTPKPTPTGSESCNTVARSASTRSSSTPDGPATSPDAASTTTS